MGQSSTADPDHSIPVMVRRAEATPSGPPPQLAQSFILITAMAAAVGGVLLLGTQPDKRLVLPVGLAYLVLSVAAALCWRATPAWQVRVLTGLFLGAVAVMGLGALRLGWALAAPAMPLLPMLVCALTIVGGLRAGGVLAAGSALMVLGVAWITGAGGSAPPVAGWPSPTLLLGTHLLSIALGLASGVILGRVVSQAVHAAHSREQRFRRLLSLAADVYWEIDNHYRVVAAGQHDQELRALKAHSGLGVLPWELPRFACDEATLDLLQADLEIRAPFRDVPFTWRGRDGSTRAYLASGEPRFDARGIFKGYWGVARDVTAVQAARAELRATESRYEELFARIPTPLVLHRHGRVIDANPAALQLFGHQELADMLGTDLLALYEEGDSSERARRRSAQLHAMPEGASLPVANFRLRAQGQVLSVQATGVRVQAQGGPALLSIFVDVSERLAAEEAVRRSEAMLAHLVATSPDLITLTDMGSGRYAMVNQAFERVTGWRADEAVGRTSLELGIWGPGEAREQFVTQLRQHGTVTDLPVRFVGKSGNTVALRVSAARFAMDRRDYMVINARDVSEDERERMERDAILDNASIGIAVTRDRHFVLANAHFEHIFGWPTGELLGRPGASVWLGDEDYAEVGRLVGPSLARGEPVVLERTSRRRDGSTFLALVRGCAIDPTRPVEGGTAWIAEDITERRQAERALARARDEAEAANRAKSSFLANTSHELRTPLNGMIGLARMACGNGISEALRRQYLDQIADSAQSLAGIISDILDLSKIEAGKLQLELAPFDLIELLGALRHTYQTLATARGLALHIEIDDALRSTGGQPGNPVLGDALRVRQVVTNFLTNAIKFTECGTVTLHARRLDAERVRIELSDTGPGIAPGALAQLFKPFTQGDQSTTRRFGGTGLGLSICRELATLMGGQVGVDSVQGQGSHFWAVLPLPPAQAAPQAVPPLPADALVGTRVLMVEDNPVNMLIAVAMLESWGVQVTQAHDGRQALDVVAQAAAAGQPFDTVLMDVQMPTMSGHEATRALRQTAAGRHLPIIALTAAALVTERDEALRAGMDEFLTKPIDAVKLQATLMRSCRVVPAR